MKALPELLGSYGEYHRDPRNKLTHVVGVPLVTLGIFQFLAWFQFIHGNGLITGATIFFTVVGLYYLKLDRQVALLTLALYLPLLILAHWLARMPWWNSLLWFVVIAVAGVAIQILGHVFEGRRPALIDNFLQIFSAPLFLTCEALILLGKRPDLAAAAEMSSSQPSEKFDKN